MNFKSWLLITEAKKSSDIAKELLGNDDLFKKIKSIIPTNIPEKLQGQLLPIAAFYYNQEEPQIVVLKDYLEDYANLVKNQKMNIITVKDDLTVDGDFKSFIHWTEIIDVLTHEGKVINTPIQGDLEGQEVIEHSPDLKIKVYLANSANQCIVLGKGESFCISRHGPHNMFQTYRDTKVSTFYFVYDNTRTDDLAITVVDVTEHGIELTDRKNDTAKTMQDPYQTTPKRITSDPDLYFKYLKEKGIDTTVFKNIPKSPEEEAEQAKLGKTNYNLNWFKALSPIEKSNYIGRVHRLSDPQFDYIHDNNIASLLKQYVKTGLKLENYQLKKVIAKKELKDIYLHNRLILDRQHEDLSKEEFNLFTPKQQEEFYNVTDELKIHKALQIEDFSLVTELIEKGQSVPYYAAGHAIKADRLDLLKYFVKHGIILDSSNPIMYAVKYGKLDILKYLIEEKNINVLHSDIEDAFRQNNIDIVRYLIDEKNISIPYNAVSIAAMHGNLNGLKYLIDEKKKNITSGDVKSASLSGELDVLKYFFDEKSFILQPKDFPFTINNAKTQTVKDYLIQKQKEQNK